MRNWRKNEIEHNRQTAEEKYYRKAWRDGTNQLEDIDDDEEYPIKKKGTGMITNDQEEMIIQRLEPEKVIINWKEIKNSTYEKAIGGLVLSEIGKENIRQIIENATNSNKSKKIKKVSLVIKDEIDMENTRLRNKIENYEELEKFMRKVLEGIKNSNCLKGKLKQEIKNNISVLVNCLNNIVNTLQRELKENERRKK